MTDDLVADVAEYVRLLGEDLVAATEQLDRLRDRYDYEYDPAENRIVFSDGNDVPVTYPSLETFAEAYNREDDDARKDRLLEELEEQYHYMGTIDKSFYTDGDDTFMLHDDEPGWIRRIDRVQSEYPLEELIQDYRFMQDFGTVEDRQELWSKNRELYRAGETGMHEVFYDQIRNQVYVFDRGDIQIAEESEDILGELEVIDMEPVDEENTFNVPDMAFVFDHLFDLEEDEE